jgi:hypothetical protein
LKRLLGIKKPTVGTVGKDHFKKWRERKTDKNYKFGLSHSLGLLHLLTGRHHSHTRIYRFDEVVNTIKPGNPENVIPAEAGIQVVRSARRPWIPACAGMTV